MTNTKQTDPTLTPLDYHCKICRKPGVAYYDKTCPITYLESWRGALCCNRCGAFHDHYSRSKESITQACVLLMQARASCAGEVLRVAEAKLRDRLTKATQRAAKLVCDFYNVTLVWGEDIVDGMMERPHGVKRALREYHAGIKAYSRQAPIVPPLPTQEELGVTA